MRTSTVLRILPALVVLGGLELASAIAFGGPKTPPPMASINKPFTTADYSDLPPRQRCKAADGASLAYRRFAHAQDRAAKGSVEPAAVSAVVKAVDDVSKGGV
jgi:non-heme chloroperoxidase